MQKLPCGFADRTLITLNAMKGWHKESREDQNLRVNEIKSARHPFFATDCRHKLGFKLFVPRFCLQQRTKFLVELATDTDFFSRIPYNQSTAATSTITTARQPQTKQKLTIFLENAHISIR